MCVCVCVYVCEVIAIESDFVENSGGGDTQTQRRESPTSVTAEQDAHCPRVADADDRVELLGGRHGIELEHPVEFHRRTMLPRQ